MLEQSQRNTAIEIADVFRRKKEYKQQVAEGDEDSAEEGVLFSLL
jgi:hypothetical protein